ncbi:hypothetical protein [Altericroceibacterium endophyticum]|uniref:Uncharacterized protein n=1 Tax=Altericroceibacterium endophyticum TaxID=1808508 RepID=A0A6I4T0R5_9SPHN|nr:hypothetical protein [Altericroceibacterium endophyticum]MXO64496.1 hypothetical protein [Altericroceibacterium endophyticum]
MDRKSTDKPTAAKNKNDSEVIRKHRALQNQSSVSPQDYPQATDKEQALAVPKKSDKK